MIFNLFTPADWQVARVQDTGLEDSITGIHMSLQMTSFAGIRTPSETQTLDQSFSFFLIFWGRWESLGHSWQRS